jgi:predicted MFS family arabinose efflux permease
LSVSIKTKEVYVSAQNEGVPRMFSIRNVRVGVEESELVDEVHDALGANASLKGDAELRIKLLRPAYRHYVLVILVLGFALNFLDRQIISVLLQPLKETFHVSDTLLGFLSGLSFALFYVTLGIPIAAMADRRSRRVIITLSMTMWCAMTALCASARTFPQLVLARVGVGIGEAGFTPAALAMIADYFPKERRASAMALAGVGPMIGIMLGLLIGGWALERFGWRGAMLMAGLPGLAFALLIWLTVKEPLRGMADGTSRLQRAKGGFLKSALHLWRIPSFRYVAVGSGLSSFALFGFSTWIPALLSRSYHMPPSHIGRILGPVLGCVGALGTLSSGFLTDRLIRWDARWSMWLPSIAAIAAAPLAASAFAAHTPSATIALYACAYYFCLFFSAPTSSIVQSLVPLDMRASGSAWKLLLENLFGLGLGSQFIGFLSDRLVPTAGHESLRQALFFATPVFLLSPVFYLLAARDINKDAAKQAGLTV